MHNTLCLGIKAAIKIDLTAVPVLPSISPTDSPEIKQKTSTKKS